METGVLGDMSSNRKESAFSGETFVSFEAKGGWKLTMVYIRQFEAVFVNVKQRSIEKPAYFYVDMFDLQNLNLMKSKKGKLHFLP